ncbi:Fungal transcriptional regulatory protein [Penicillium brevicompactum]
MSRPLKHRDIACARCFRLKRKCDHAKPSCSECRRKGAECLPARSRKAGDNITIPLSYLKQLEARVAELGRPSQTAPLQNTCDVGVQTDIDLGFDAQQSLTGPDISELNNALTFPGVQLASPKLWRTPGYLSPDSFSAFFDIPWMDMAPLTPFASDDTPWLKELYANMYFSVTHREWPFLDEAIWKSWHTNGVSDGQDEWRAFFLQMVYAIGASLFSTLQRDTSHSFRSKEFYTSAMRYYPHVVGHSSMLLQIQASLLMILYALHSPSSEEITTSVGSVLPFCVATMAEIRKHAALSSEIGSGTGVDDVLLEKMFITCYMLNEVIVSGWDRPVSAAYRVVDDDMCSLGDTLQPALGINPALSHLFRLRKIQANIRRSREALPCQDLVGDFKSRLSLFKPALDSWRQDIPQNALKNVQSGYLHPIWMQKLYDYSLLILGEGTREFTEMDGMKDMVAAIVDVCLNFRMLQEEGHVMCYTWSALVFQFRAGIMLLYIAWTTRSMSDCRDQQIQQSIQQAISTCTTNLTVFGDRWTDAMPYLRVFEFLHQKILQPGDAFEVENETVVSLEEAELNLGQLKKRYLHRAVLGMIEDMMYGGIVQEELLEDDLMEFVQGERDEHDLSIVH